VVGLKPTYDLISRRGVFPLSWSLDHVGFFTRTVEDATIVLNVLSGVEHRPEINPGLPKLGLLRRYYEETAEEAVWAGLMDAANRLEAAGADIIDVQLPPSFEYVHPAHSIIFAAEAASVHEEGFTRDPDAYKPKMRNHVAAGLLIPTPAYLRAKRIRGVFAMEARDLLGDVDCLLTPSSVTPALRGLESTGDPAFNAAWSFCGFPAITVPCGLTGDGLPLGLQLTGLPHGEEELLTAAGWCEGVLDFPKRPREPRGD
jgi:aspartyl-tRNA(Asn)/glutamyl-tRNA(Gln) amidotransferase subunit A